MASDPQTGSKPLNHKGVIPVQSGRGHMVAGQIYRTSVVESPSLYHPNQVFVAIVTSYEIWGGQGCLGLLDKGLHVCGPPLDPLPSLVMCNHQTKLHREHSRRPLTRVLPKCQGPVGRGRRRSCPSGVGWGLEGEESTCCLALFPTSMMRCAPAITSTGPPPSNLSSFLH